MPTRFYSGELWSSGNGWSGPNKTPNMKAFIEMCVSKGVQIIGGCCRIDADQLSTMRQVVDEITSHAVKL